MNKNYVQVVDLGEQTIIFGGKHIVRPPRTDNPHTWLPGHNDENRPNKDIYTVNVSRDALRNLKEQLES